MRFVAPPAVRAPLPRILVAAACIALAAGAFPAAAGGQEASAEQTVRFTIETITIEGADRSSPRIVISESLLRTGESYTEAELAQAAFRIKRLPFILDADFRLEKGSERGLYGLVIEVDETRRLFFGADDSAVYFADPVSLSSYQPGWEQRRDAVAGIRHFVGAYGVAHAGLRSNRGVEIGYTHYNLFDRWVFASASWARDQGSSRRLFSLGLDPTFSDWWMSSTTQLALAMGFPLSSRQSLRVSVSELEGEPDQLQVIFGGDRSANSFRLLQRGLEHRVAEVRWIYDTTDDPTLPRRGTVATAGVHSSTFEASLGQGSDLSSPASAAADLVLPVADTRLAALVGSWHHTVPLTRRQTLTTGVRASAGRGEAEALWNLGLPGTQSYDAYDGRLEAVHAVDILQQGGDGDLRLETHLLYGREEVRGAAFGSTVDRAEAALEVVYRNTWGLLRLGVRYVDLSRSVR